MKYRPSPDFVAVIIILAALILTTLYLLGAIYFWQSAQADEFPTVGNEDWRPDISHCFAPEADEKYDELWDCIRHEEKNSE